MLLIPLQMLVDHRELLITWSFRYPSKEPFSAPVHTNRFHPSCPESSVKGGIPSSYTCLLVPADQVHLVTYLLAYPLMSKM